MLLPRATILARNQPPYAVLRYYCHWGHNIAVRMFFPYQTRDTGSLLDSCVFQCVKQSSRGSCPPVSGGVIRRGTVQRPPEALAKFFSRLLRIDQFSCRIWCLGQIMYTFRGCESHDFYTCHSTFLSVNCRPVTHNQNIFACVAGIPVDGEKIGYEICWRCERVHIHLCWNKKCVRDIYLMKLYPFPLTLCVLINKKGVDTMTFCLTWKSPRQNLKTKSVGVGGPIFVVCVGDPIFWCAPQARFFRFSIWISKRFLDFLTSRLLSVWLYSSYFLNHLPLS